MILVITTEYSTCVWSEQFRKRLDDNIMDDQRQKNTEPEVPAGLMAFGVVMIVIGGYIAFFVGQEALSVYRQWDDNVFIESFVEKYKDSNLLSLGDDSLVVSEHGAGIIGFVMFTLLALLGVHIAVALIRAGAHIVSPAFPYQIAQLKRRIDSLHEKLRSR